MEPAGELRPTGPATEIKLCPGHYGHRAGELCPGNRERRAGELRLGAVICLPWVPSDRAGQGAVDIAAGRTGEAEAISERICATRQDVATTPEKSHSHRSSAGRTRLVKAHV